MIGQTIELVQGDTLNKNVIVRGVSESDIDSIYFTCHELDIEKQLVYDSNIEKWVLKIEAAETKTYKTITTDYDLTIKFTDDDISTVLYRGIFKVLPKVNEVGGLDE